MSTALTLRLPERDAEEIRRIAVRERRSVSEVGARIVDEWLRQNRYPQLEFRSVNGERVACIKGRLEVWQVVMVANGYSDDVCSTAAHLDLRPDQVQAALEYALEFPNEINAALVENRQGFERLKRLLPQLQRTTLTDEELSSIDLVDVDTSASHASQASS